MSQTLTCPTCSHKISLADSSGELLVCPKCKRKIKLEPAQRQKPKAQPASAIRRDPAVDLSSIERNEQPFVQAMLGFLSVMVVGVFLIFGWMAFTRSGEEPSSENREQSLNPELLPNSAVANAAVGSNGAGNPAEAIVDRNSKPAEKGGSEKTATANESISPTPVTPAVPRESFARFLPEDKDWSVLISLRPKEFLDGGQGQGRRAIFDWLASRVPIDAAPNPASTQMIFLTEHDRLALSTFDGDREPLRVMSEMAHSPVETREYEAMEMRQFMRSGKRFYSISLPGWCIVADNEGAIQRSIERSKGSELISTTARGVGVVSIRATAPEPAIRTMISLIAGRPLDTVGVDRLRRGLPSDLNKVEDISADLYLGNTVTINGSLRATESKSAQVVSVMLKSLATSWLEQMKKKLTLADLPDGQSHYRVEVDVKERRAQFRIITSPEFANELLSKLLEGNSK